MPYGDYTMGDAPDQGENEALNPDENDFIKALLDFHKQELNLIISSSNKLVNEDLSEFASCAAKKILEINSALNTWLRDGDTSGAEMDHGDHSHGGEEDDGPDWAESMPTPQQYAVEEAPVAAAGAEEFAWEGPIVFEGVVTGDNRVFNSGSITWDEKTLPWPFRWQKASTQGHAGAVAIGRVDSLARMDNGVIYGKGVIIPSLNEEATEYLRLIQAGVASGVSVDGDSAQFDVKESETGGQPRVEFSNMRLRSLTAVDIPAFNEARVRLENHTVTSTDALLVVPVPEAAVEEAPVEAPISDKHDDLRIALEMKRKKMRVKHSSYSGEVLTAAAIPVKPSTDAFLEPNFDGPTALTVTKEGTVFGHLALFDTCHIGFKGTCVTPPKGSAYRYFHTGQVETAEGDMVETGRLTFNTGHAGMSDSPKAAAAHYDHTGTVAADVRCGEDQFGIWVAGALRSTLSDEDIRAFRAAPLSGDWRRIAGKLELVGALAVNVPGFPVPRVRALVASGETETLFTFTEDAEYEDRMAISNYEAQLRSAKKAALAAKFSVDTADELEEFAAEDDSIPPVPTKAEIDAKAKSITNAEAMGYLKDIKALLDDPEEVDGEEKAQLEAIYKDAMDGLASKAAAGDTEDFSAEDLEEFYNHAHGKGGLFTSGGGKSSGGGGGGRQSRFGGSHPQGKADGGKFATRLGNARDPLNQLGKTSSQSREKMIKARRSAARWASAAIIAGAIGVGTMGTGSFIAPMAVGFAVGSLANAAIRHTQFSRHMKQTKALSLQERNKG